MIMHFAFSPKAGCPAGPIESSVYAQRTYSTLANIDVQERVAR
jgi:hypothetical protein